MKTVNFLFSFLIILLATATLSAQDLTDDAWKNNGNNVYVDDGTKVGIGSNVPKTHLFMQTQNKFGLSLHGAANGWSTIGSNWAGGSKLTAGHSSIVQFTPDGSVWFRINKNGNTLANGGWDTPLRMYQGGFVVVGSQDKNMTKDNFGNVLTGYKLFVKDGILTEKVKVAISTTDDWSDFVFADDYKLNSIETVEEFVKENKHLPNIPSAEAVVENGVNVAEMDAKLLRQIEELWLHVIELKKKNDALEAKFEGSTNKN